MIGSCAFTVKEKLALSALSMAFFAVTNDAFATLQADGSIKAWGTSSSGGAGAPAGNDYTKIYGLKSGKGIVVGVI
jgi:hypothetical protein